MEFGDRSRFAIAVELNEDSGGTWLFGKFCCWIDGRTIADYHTSLSDVLQSLKWAVWDCGKRDDCDLFALSKDAAFAAINSALYGNADNADAPGELARFDVTLYGESAAWKAFLIDCGDKSRVIYKSGSDDIGEIQLARGEFDHIIKSVQEALIAMYDRAESEGR